MPPETVRVNFREDAAGGPSLSPLQPAVATSVAAHLAALYGADRASADWRHCGRLAGFTNQKPAPRQPGGYAPWVRLVYAQPQLATDTAVTFPISVDFASCPRDFSYIGRRSGPRLVE
jgi:hypothetical protein